MCSECGTPALDFVNECPKLAGGVLLDQQLLDVASEFEPRH